MIDHITVQFGKRSFTVYVDGIVYAEDGKDVPTTIFKIRDAYVKAVHG